MPLLQNPETMLTVNAATVSAKDKRLRQQTCCHLKLNVPQVNDNPCCHFAPGVVSI